MINNTIDYYNSNAEAYFKNTINVDMASMCDKFLDFIKPKGTIIDIGTGSGRDLKYFLDRGFKAEGIDLSEEMCKLASAFSGGKVTCVDICDWNPNKKYDGVWANASLLHLPINDIEKFFLKLPEFLEENGVAYISMKSGIESGYDDKGRYFTDFSEKDLHQILSKSTELLLIDCWRTRDELNRDSFEWINILIKRK